MNLKQRACTADSDVICGRSIEACRRHWTRFININDLRVRTGFVGQMHQSITFVCKRMASRPRAWNRLRSFCVRSSSGSKGVFSGCQGRRYTRAGVGTRPLSDDPEAGVSPSVGRERTSISDDLELACFDGPGRVTTDPRRRGPPSAQPFTHAPRTGEGWYAAEPTRGRADAP